MTIMKSFVLFLILTLSFVPATAAVIRVEKDGSGDFTIIQDAVDYASDGDEIWIGPGRFDDFQTDPEWGDFRVILDGTKSLTFQGAGPQETIIGPYEYDGQFCDWGILSYPGNNSVRVADIRFENLDRVGVNLNSDFSEIENCEFHGCYDSLRLFSGISSVVSGCKIYDSNYGSGAQPIYSTSASLSIDNTEILGCSFGISCQGGSNNISITNCTIDGQGEGVGGISFINVGGTISNCRFSNIKNGAFSGNGGKDIILTDNVFENMLGDGVFVGTGVYLVNGGDSFFASGNIFTENDICFKLASAWDQFSVYNNHIFRAESIDGLFVLTASNVPHGEYHWDFRNNYWGTTDAEEISQWIVDGYDSLDNPYYVDFLPLADGPVPTENIAFGGVKALYR